MKLPRLSLIALLLVSFSPLWCGRTAAAVSLSPLAVMVETDGESTGVAEQCLLTGAEVTVKVEGQQLRVVGAAGMTLEVYSLTGTKVLAASVEANDKTFSLNLPRGWYIVKVGSLTRKVAVQ